MKITKIETIQLTVNIDRGVGEVENNKGYRFQSKILMVLVHTN